MVWLKPPRRRTSASFSLVISSPKISTSVAPTAFAASCARASNRRKPVNPSPFVLDRIDSNSQPNLRSELRNCESPFGRIGKIENHGLALQERHDMGVIHPEASKRFARTTTIHKVSTRRSVRSIMPQVYSIIVHRKTHVGNANGTQASKRPWQVVSRVSRIMGNDEANAVHGNRSLNVS